VKAVSETDGPALVRRLWELIEARAWASARELLADDFAAEWPHSRERFRGGDAFIGMNRAYPEGWTIEVLDVVGDGDRVASEVRVTHPEGTFYAASFFTLREGKLASLHELWVTEGEEEPPAWRAQFAERY
jgi:ketosteroid isomerase-like protein